MRVHVFVIESEKPGSTTSVRNIFNEVCATLQKASKMGQSVFLNAPTRVEVIVAAKTFSTWCKNIPSTDIVVLWPSIHGANPEPGVAPEKRKLVGTSGASAAKERIEWNDFFAAAKQATEPGRVLILMDVCWGSSPTAPARLSTPAAKRPAMLFGPARSAKRSELDAATRAVFDHLKGGRIPDIAVAKAVVDSLNKKFPAAQTTGTSFYRVWWWDDMQGLQRHPEPPIKARIAVKPKR